MQLWNVFKTIMWKNYILRKRHFIFTILEITFPSLIFGFLVFIRVHIGTQSDSILPTYIPNSYNVDDCFYQFYGLVVVAFAPNNEFTREIMTKVKGIFWKQHLGDGVDKLNNTG